MQPTLTGQAKETVVVRISPGDALILDALRGNAPRDVYLRGLLQAQHLRHCANYAPITRE